MERNEIAAMLKEIGLMLEIKGESFFKSRAYYEAARQIEIIPEDIEELVYEGRLQDIKGFGKALTEKITELVTTGKLGYYEQLRTSFPDGLFDLLKLQGIGPKKVGELYRQIGITNIDDLEKACVDNKLVNLKGFGTKTQDKILESIRNYRRYDDRYLFYQLEDAANLLLQLIEKDENVIRCNTAGSIRRKKEIIKDIDIVASSHNPQQVMKTFTSNAMIEQITASGDTKSSVILKGGIKADIRVVKDNEYPYALNHFTGSKEHNTALRHFAKQMGLKINEYGVFKDGSIVACTSEREFYNIFGMDYIPPEIREDNGELEAALLGSLPELVELQDVRGVIHVHTLYSDGSNTIEELVKTSIDKGYEYIGISDHSKSAYYAGGLQLDDIKRQHEEIDRLNEKYTDFLILKGIEVDILKNGELDYSGDVLSTFDFTIASIHSSFNMDEDKMTQRIVKALESGYVTMLGHPTGRLLLSREPYKVDLMEVIRKSVQNNVIIEINAHPHRLDLDWRYCKQAKELGAKFAIGVDTHYIKEFDYTKYGVYTARKGWLTRDDIINCIGRADILRNLSTTTCK